MLKSSHLLIVIGCAAALLVGCDRRTPEEQEPPIAEPEVAPLPGAPKVTHDPALLGDQQAISRRLSRTETTVPDADDATSEAPEEPDGRASDAAVGPGVTTARSRVAEALQQARDGTPEAVARLFPEPAASDLASLFSRIGQVQSRLSTVQQALQREIGQPLPPKVLPALAPKLPAMNRLVLGEWTIDQLRFVETAAGVNVSGPGNQTVLRFVGADDEMAAQPPMQLMENLGPHQRLVQAQLDFLQRVSSALEEDALSAENYSETLDEWYNEMLERPLSQLMGGAGRASHDNGGIAGGGLIARFSPSVSE
jgi:hypothetical protein